MAIVRLTDCDFHDAYEVTIDTNELHRQLDWLYDQAACLGELVPELDGLINLIGSLSDIAECAVLDGKSPEAPDLADQAALSSPTLDTRCGEASKSAMSINSPTPTVEAHGETAR